VRSPPHGGLSCRRLQRRSARGETFAALLRDAEALGASAVLNTRLDDALDVETLYHGAAVLIKRLNLGPAGGRRNLTRD
jgi:uncharacterized protein YbjQ (UPF0145 family)